MGHNNPSLWTVVKCIEKDAQCAADILRCDLGEPTLKRVKKATKAHQQRLLYLCVQYVSGAKSVEEFLSGIGHVIRIK